MAEDPKREDVYQSGTDDEEAAGLAVTHEQVMDAYVAGSSDGVLFLKDGKTVDLGETSVTYDE